MKRKIRISLLVLVFAIPLLYFMFTLLFFSPFEEDFGPIENIVPRGVDLYLSKVDLSDDFVDFPVPDFYIDLKVNREWRTFLNTELYGRMSGGKDLDDLFNQIKSEIEAVPFDPIEDVVGRQVAFAGTFDDEGNPSQYLVFFRGSWKAKLYFELLTWDFVRGMADDPLVSQSSVDMDPRGFVSLVLSDGSVYYLKRCFDLIIVGNDEDLMVDVAGLVSLGKDAYDLSLAGASTYSDKIGAVSHEEKDLVDFHVNLEKLFDRVAFDEEWKANEIDFSVMTAMEIFDPLFFRDLTGTVDLMDSLVLDARSELYEEGLSEAKTGFFGLDSLNMEECMTELASMLPDDIFVAGCARLHVREFLEIVDTNLDPDFRRLVTDIIREASRHNPKWRVSGTWDFIEYLDMTFGQKVFFALRPRAKDKPIERFEQPLPIIALIFEVNDPVKVRILVDTIINLQNSSKRGYEMWKWTENFHTCSIMGINAAGMEEDLETIAFTTMGDRYFVIATSEEFIKDIVYAWASPEPILERVPLFARAAESIDGFGNFGLFMDINGFRRALNDYANFWACLQTELPTEQMKAEREKVKRRLLAQGAFGNKRELTLNQKVRLEEMVDEEMLRLNEERLDAEVPKHEAAFRENCAWLDLFKSLALVIDVNRHDMDVKVRLETVLDKEKRSPRR